MAKLLEKRAEDRAAKREKPHVKRDESMVIN